MSSAGSCPFCRMAAGGDVETCPGCGLDYHADCWSENQGCAVPGCAGRPTEPSQQGEPAVVATGAEAAVPAGRWERDPTGRHQYRWWDGNSWTHHVSDAGQTGVDTVPPSPPAPSTPSATSISPPEVASPSQEFFSPQQVHRATAEPLPSEKVGASRIRQEVPPQTAAEAAPPRTAPEPSEVSNRSGGSRARVIAAVLAGIALGAAAVLLIVQPFGDEPAPVADDASVEEVQAGEGATGEDDLASSPLEGPEEPDVIADGLLAELQSTGTVRVGVANEIPFGYVGDDGRLTGIAPDVARAVLNELGIDTLEAEVVPFGDLIVGLQAGQFDMISAGMYITPDRANQIYFSDPDYCIPESLAVAEGNPYGLTDYQSIAANPNVIIAVAFGTVEMDYVEDAGIPDHQIEVFDDIHGMFRALETGQVDAVAGTASTIRDHASDRVGVQALPGFFPVDAQGNEWLPCGGHGFADEEFRDAFNDVLNRFRDDGTTAEIITAYREFTVSHVELANELTLRDFLGTSATEPEAAGSDWTNEVRTNFLDECLEASGGERLYCVCVLETLEARYNLAEFEAMERTLERGGELPAAVESIIDGCAATHLF